MNDIATDWGPARHDPSDPRHEHALAAWFDQRDASGERPDDN
jgi:hypothetical protein